MRKLLIALPFALLTAIPAQAEDLEQVYQLALKSDPTFLAAEQQFMASQEIRNQAFSLFLPALNLNANYNNINQDYEKLDKFDYNSYGAGLNLNQLIYDNAYFVQYKQAGYQVAQAAAQFNSAAQDLIVRTSQAYFDVLAAYDNLTFTEAEEKSIYEQLVQTKQRFEVGLTAITDVAEAQSRYDQTRAQSIAARNLLAVSRESLRAIIGVYPDKLALLTKDIPLVKPTPENVDEWAKIAQESSLTLLVAEKALQIAKEEVRRQRSGHLPTLNLVASANYSDSDRQSAFSFITGNSLNDNRIGLQLKAPIYLGGRVSSLTRQAAYTYQQSRELYEKSRRLTDQQTRTSYLNVLSNISQVQAFKQALKSTRTALKATEAGYEVGTRTSVDVLNSRREVYRAERDYAKSRYLYILDTLRLRQAAGILTDEAVVAINKWLK